jgi:hypothetical protein
VGVKSFSSAVGGIAKDEAGKKYNGGERSISTLAPPFQPTLQQEEEVNVG